MSARERSQAINEYIAIHNAYREEQMTTLKRNIQSLDNILQHYLFIDVTNDSATPLKFHISNNLQQYEKQILNKLINHMAYVDDVAKMLETNILPLIDAQLNSQSITYFDKKVEEIVNDVWDDLFANTAMRTLDGKYQLSPANYNDIRFIGFISSKKLMTNNQSMII